MSNELKRHKKSDKVKWGITTAVGVVLSAAIVFGGLELWGGEGVKPSTWFTPVEEQPEEQPDDADRTGGMVITEDETEDNENAIALTSMAIPQSDYAQYGISPLAESAQILYATITPEGATNKQLVWSVAWDQVAEDSGGENYYTGNAFYYDEDTDGDYEAANLSSIGITENDFIQIQPSSDTLSCTVTCTQPFGCPITITCTSEDNGEATADCRVDYLADIITPQFTGSDISLEDVGSNNSINFSFAYSAGTLYPEYNLSVKVQGKIDFNTLFVDAGFEYTDDETGFMLPHNASWHDTSSFYINADGDYVEDDPGIVITNSGGRNVFTYNDTFETFVFKYLVNLFNEDVADSQKKEILEKVRVLLNDENVKALLAETPLWTITGTLHNETTDQEVSISKDIYLADVSQVSSLRVPVENVQLDNDNLVFGGKIETDSV